MGETGLRVKASILGGIKNNNNKAVTQELVAVLKLPCAEKDRGECVFWHSELHEETWQLFVVLTPLFLAGEEVSEVHIAAKSITVFI